MRPSGYVILTTIAVCVLGVLPSLSAADRALRKRQHKIIVTADGFGNKRKPGRKKALTKSCTLLEKIVNFGNGKESESNYECEISDADGPGGTIVTLPQDVIDTIKSRKGTRDAVRSGQTKMFIEGSQYDEEHFEMENPRGKAPSFSNIGEDGEGNGKTPRRLALPTGDKKVLVVRTQASNDNTGPSTSQLSDAVFGTSGDSVNLKSQYLKCSNDQLNFIPATNPPGTSGIVDGAVTITVDVSTSQGDTTMRNAITAEINSQFGVNSPTQVANYAMYCLPPNTMNGIAYAFINSWMSVYSNNWCTYLSAQIHELGHNLNFAHSNENGQEYNDQSGMMGYSYSQDDTPEMCFNAAKMWQSNWFPSNMITFEVVAGATPLPLRMYGLASVKSIGSGTMFVKINNPSSGTDHYVAFNLKQGFNIGTVEGGDNVMVVSAGGEGTGYAPSSLLAKLGNGSQYNFNSNSQTVYIKAQMINTGASPPYADVCIKVNDSTDCSFDDPEPSSFPSVSPSITKSTSPSLLPTSLPSASASQPPSITNVPSVSPLAGVTSPPSFTTSASPSLRPTQAAPTSRPSASASLPPSTIKSTSPSILPTTFAPTSSPSGSLSLSPSISKLPTPAPTTKSPTQCVNPPRNQKCSEANPCCPGWACPPSGKKTCVPDQDGPAPGPSPEPPTEGPPTQCQAPGDRCKKSQANCCPGSTCRGNGQRGRCVSALEDCQAPGGICNKWTKCCPGSFCEGKGQMAQCVKDGSF